MPGRGPGRPRHPDLLTPGEQRVLEELRNGGTNAEIAVRLGLSPETVKTHIARMLSKLDLADRRQLAAWRPKEQHRRRRAVLPLSAALAWTGGVVAVVAVIVAIGVMLAVFTGEGDQPPEAIPAHKSTLSRETCLRTVVGRDPEAFCLAAISDASGDSVMLEWTTGTPIDATKWQYRLHRSAPVRVSDGFDNLTFGRETLAWGEWHDIPNSDVETRGVRLTGLPAGQAFDFQVRAITRSGPGEPSVIANLALTAAPEHRLRLEPGLIVEGDGRSEWLDGGTGFVVTVPRGVRLVAPDLVNFGCGSEGLWWPEYPQPTREDGGHFYWDQGPFAATWMCYEEYLGVYFEMCGRDTYLTHLTDLTTGSLLMLTREGEEITRCVAEGDSQRVEAIFDQVLDSVRFPGD